MVLTGKKRPFTITKHFYWNMCFFCAHFYTGHLTRISRKKNKTPPNCYIFYRKDSFQFFLSQLFLFFFFTSKYFSFFFSFFTKRNDHGRLWTFPAGVRKGALSFWNILHHRSILFSLYSIIQLHFSSFHESGTSLFSFNY